ncbi:MAG: hypothetical protein ACI4JJ_03200 [Huintestinicola sp.]
MNKIKLYQLIGKINNCITSGTEQDFADLIPQMNLSQNYSCSYRDCLKKICGETDDNIRIKEIMSNYYEYALTHFL